MRERAQAGDGGGTEEEGETDPPPHRVWSPKQSSVPIP